MSKTIESKLKKEGWKQLPDGTLEKVMDEYCGEDKWGRPWTEPTTANVEVYIHNGKIFGAVFIDVFDEEIKERVEKFDEQEITSAEDVENIVREL